ncbi:MAG TPA: pyridoxamine 5'-phosphate oxidase family protein [Methylomirabilota bacterium]|nr:pyridoxamine 5'-phosphate oxidase family protein [Methylomirabilota bacterium]
MSRSLGPALPPDLLARLSQSDLPAVLGRAVPVITADESGRPHPMLVSYLELLAVDPATIRLVIGARSRSARNLDERGSCALLLIEPERTVYVKGRARRRFTTGELARFDLAVEDVLEDSPADWEAGIRITGGITYAPPPACDAPWARDVLALLRAERAP